MAVAHGRSPIIDELVNALGLKNVTEFSFSFKKNSPVTVTATMRVYEDAVKELIEFVKKYDLVEIENKKELS